jgi:hypothetical protein
MTRNDFIALEWALRQAYPKPGDLSRSGRDSDHYAGRIAGWRAAVDAVADVCAASNDRFDRYRFDVASGYSRQWDGSMFPMDPPR